MQKNCRSCSESFEITNEDLNFYDKVSPVFGGKKYQIPPPTLCPDCRLQQRMAFRNERHLYYRKSDLGGQDIISIYSADRPHKVYSYEEWWSDAFDPLQYGRNYDFTVPFFKQFSDLMREVPKLPIHNAKSENCLYTNYSAENRNCYLVIGSLGSEDCYYSYRIFYSKDIIDCFDLYKCELCYECALSKNLYGSSYCDHCFNSSCLILCSNCTGCQDCFGCVNLKGKQYYIFNQKYEKEDYFQKIKVLKENFADAQKQYNNLKMKSPHRSANIVSCENCKGNNLFNCKNCFQAFIFKNSQDCRYVAFGDKNVSCTDVNFVDNCELQYNSAGLEKNYKIICANLAWYVNNSYYISICFNSENLFGCVGMKKNKYCILNKQYGREEYEKIVPKIIEHMEKNNEWGEFFPAKISPFAYNETVAQTLIPLTKEQALKQGFIWKDTDQKEYRKPTSEILSCEKCDKNYKIIPQELKFYKKMNLSFPQKCPDCRHNERVKTLRLYKFWLRLCSKCGKEIETTYPLEDTKIIYCEDCYLKEVY